MRVKLAFAAITVVALGVVGCNDRTPEPSPSPQSVCDEAMTIPPYTVTFEDGSKASIPSGPEQFADADPEHDPVTVCAAILGQWEHDQRVWGVQVR